MSVLKKARLGILLVLCIILGGTSQNILDYKLVLYIASILMIGWILTDGSRESLSRLNIAPMWVLGAFGALYCLYIIPLPPEIWTSLPGRNIVKEGFDILSLPLPYLPASLTPEMSFLSMLHLLPPLAILLITLLCARQTELKWAFYAVLGMAVGSIILGLLQLLMGGTDFYLYEYSHFGLASGFFSNANHQASFLVMILPFAVYMALAGRSGKTSNSLIPQHFAVGVCFVFLTMVGIVLTGSIAGYMLAAIVFPLSFYVMSRGGYVNYPLMLLVVTIFSSFLVFDFLVLGNYSQELIDEFTINIRPQIFITSLEAGKGYFPFGSGPGSFEATYLFYQDKSSIYPNYVNKAHNDYVQLFHELGVFGIFLCLLLITGLARLVYLYLISPVKRSEKIYALCVVSFLAVAMHSVADYPLRTPAISALGAFLIGIIWRKNYSS